VGIAVANSYGAGRTPAALAGAVGAVMGGGGASIAFLRLQWVEGALVFGLLGAAAGGAIALPNRRLKNRLSRRYRAEGGP
jgi:hypothetical protein